MSIPLSSQTLLFIIIKQLLVGEVESKRKSRPRSGEGFITIESVLVVLANRMPDRQDVDTTAHLPAVHCT